MVRRTRHEPVAEEFLPILLRTTGLLALSVLAVRVVLGRLRPASPSLCRAAYALALVQGILIVRLSVPVPWSGRMMSAPTAPSSLSRDEPTSLPDRGAPQPSRRVSARKPSGRSTHVAALPTRQDGSAAIPRSVGNWTRLLVAGWLAGMAGLLASPARRLRPVRLRAPHSTAGRGGLGRGVVVAAGRTRCPTTDSPPHERSHGSSALPHPGRLPSDRARVVVASARRFGSAGDPQARAGSLHPGRSLEVAGGPRAGPAPLVQPVHLVGRADVR